MAEYDYGEALEESLQREKQLKADLKAQKVLTRLWKKRTAEAANAVEQFEELQAENKRIKNSTKECRKDCDVYKDWQQIEADNVGLVLANSKFQAENERLKDKIVQLREWYGIEQLRAENKQLKKELWTKNCADCPTFLAMKDEVENH